MAADLPGLRGLQHRERYRIVRLEYLHLPMKLGALSMVRLETFGGANLVHGGDDAAPQRRRVALFALLAVAGDRGMTREKLVGYLWPESTIDNARHSLEQLAYGVRRAYGVTVLLGGNPLRVNADAFSSDVQEFEKAIASGDRERAAALYRGPFLDGFFLPDAPEFERWATTESQRLAAQAAWVLEELASDCARHGDHRGAVGWERKRAALDPLSARGATLLMQALADSGDTSGALQHAAMYARLMRQELETDPDPSVTRLAAALRAEPPIRTGPHETERSRQPPSAAAYGAPQEAPRIALEDAPSTRGPGNLRTPAPSRHRWIFAFLIAAAALLLGIFALSRRPTRGEWQAQASRVAVLPFRATVKDSSLAYLGEGVMDLLSARFTGEGGPAAINSRAVMGAWHNSRQDPPPETSQAAIARSLGANELIDGEVIQTGPRELTLNARLVATNGGRLLVSETVRGPVDSIASMTDALANRLLASRAGEQRQRIASIISAAPGAVTAFLQGRGEYRRGHVTEARGYFAKALDIDSTFALAAIELGLATGQLFQWSTVLTDTVRETRGVAMGGGGHNLDISAWARAIRLAARDTTRLSAGDRLLLAALRGGYPRAASARQVLANWENVAHGLPELPDAHFWYGHVLLFQGPAMGLEDARPRARASFQRALELDERYTPALLGLIDAAAFDRDTIVMNALVARYTARDSTSDEAFYIRWRLAALRGDATGLRLLRARFSSLGPSALTRIRLMAQLDATSLDDAARANSLLLAGAGSAVERQLGLHSARQIALNGGRPAEARAILAVKRELEPNADLQRGYAIRDGMFWDSDSAAAAAAVRAFEATIAEHPEQKPDDRRTSYMRFSVALWRLFHGDTTRAAHDIARLRQATTGRETQSAVLDALLADVAGRADAPKALARLDSLASLGFGPAPHVINLVSARIHERRGNLRGALAAVRRGRWYFPPENLTTYLREEGRLAALTGDRESAIIACSSYLALRSHTEPSMARQVNTVRARLAMLRSRGKTDGQNR